MRIADRLAAAQESGFFGRRPELELFREALAAPALPFTILHVHGPGGVGKTTLLRELARLAREAGRPVVTMDGRDVAPTPEAFLRALGEAGERAGLADEAVPPGAVVFIDTYESLAALDDWLRETLLPSWPSRVLVVLAGREAPAVAWRTDIAWSALTRMLPLRNLEPGEARAFLGARGVDPATQARILGFTHGHPLALALVADLLRQRGQPGGFDPQDAPDVVRHLSGLFLDTVPNPAQREALDVCAVARVTREPLLVELFGREAGQAAFAWLRSRSFVESGPLGLFPHDLVREVVLADARWRDEAALGALSRRIYTALHGQAAAAAGRERQRLQMDTLYVKRLQPSNAAFFDWAALDGVQADPAEPGDEAWVLELVARHEGAAAADLARAWWRAQRAAFQVFHGPGGTRFGFLALLDIGETASGEPADPAVAAARAFVQAYGPVARGEGVVHLRWWMHADAYQAVTAAINLTAAHVVSHCITRPGIAWNFVAMADPSFWVDHFAGVNFPRVPEADFEVDGRRHGVFAHDWRVEPPGDWMVGVRTPMPFAAPVDGPASAPGLGPAEFAEAVRQALRDYTRREALASGPLSSSRLLRGLPDARTRGEALQSLLRSAVDDLRAHPRDVKLHRAIWHTYIEPLPTQEVAAERLGLPFSTYRHHLARGIERVTRVLWHRERALPPA
jgi:AAA ATPase-like protein